MYRLSKYAAAIFGIYLFLFQTTSYAAEVQVDKNVPTVYFDLGLGITTYKSKLVESNDTSFTTAYNLGLFGGSEKNWGMGISKESNQTSFSYADSNLTSKILSSYQSTLFKYRWEFICFGIILDQASFTISKQGQPYLDAIATGTGAFLEIRASIGKSNQLFFTYSQVSNSGIKETEQYKTNTLVKLGSRSDIQLGGIIPLTKRFFDLQLGYRQRSFAMSVGGETFAEAVSMTWLGLGMKADF